MIPDAISGIKGADKLLVPYDKYVELWNRAHPDKKIETKAAPAPYALAGATYQTVVGRGRISVVDRPDRNRRLVAGGSCRFRLRLGGGVLAQAELDGKPARLSVAAAANLSK